MAKMRLSVRHWAVGLLALSLLSGSGCDCGGGDALDRFAPALRVAPEAVDFGGWPVGAEVTREITLINDGNAPIELVGTLTIEGPEAAGFAIERADPFPLEGGSIQEVVVRFAPSREEPFEGVLVLPLADPVGRVEVPLVGEGSPAAVELSPEVLAFGDVPVGESRTLTVTVSSQSEASLQVPLVVEGGGFLLNGAARRTLTLPPGGEEDVVVTFVPGRGGAFEAGLVAAVCGDGCGPRAVLTGTGLAPRIDVTPRPVDFGEVLQGEDASVPVTLRNAGVGTLTVSALTVLDAAARMTVTDAPALPLALQAGESAQVEVSYGATVPEAEVRASLVVESNDPLSPRVSVPLFASTPGAALRVIPAAVHFGRLDPGVTRDLDVVVLSSGTAPVSLSGAVLTGEGAGAFELLTALPSLPHLLEPYDSLLLTLRAVPREADAVAGGAAASLALSTLEGITAQSELTFASGNEGCQPRVPLSSLNLGAIRVGLGASGVVEVVNVGTAACTFQSFGPAPGLVFDGGFSWATQGLESLAPGATGRVTVAYVASSPGTASAYFSLRFLESPAPTFLSATAWGVLGSLVPEPPSVTFGPNVEGCPARAGVVAYVNDGAGPVGVSDIRLEPVGAAFDFAPVIVPRSVAAGGTLEIVVTPRTTSAGTFTGRLIAVSEEAGEVVANLTSYVEEPGSPVAETFLVEDATAKVDVLFIIDNSYSMVDDQQELADNFAAFIDEADGEGAVDFHIGVTTTDVISPDAARGGLLGSPKVLKADTPGLAAAFADRALVGVDGHGLELGLEAMRLALSEPTLSNTNGGFYRPDAALSVIVVSDEDDSGNVPNLTEYYPEGARSVEGYISFLSALKGGTLSNAPVLFNAVSGPAPRYQALVDAFGGVHLDLGSPDWGTQLGVVGAATFGLGRTFQLASEPQPGTVVITIDGTPTTGFSLIPGSHTVVLDEVPPAGAEVVVSYVPECT